MFARDVVALARKHRIRYLRLGFSFGEYPPTQMTWNAENTTISLETPRQTPPSIPWRKSA